MGLYTEAAGIIRQAKAKKASVKTLVLSRSTYPNKKQLYALVCETIKHTEILRQVEARVGLLEKVDVLAGDEELLHVLLYDQLIGRGIKGSHNLRVPVQRYRSALKAEYKKLNDKETGAGKVKKERASCALPRYVRVNLLKASKEDVVSVFRDEGWKLSAASEISFVEAVRGLGQREFLPDPHLKDVLVFQAGTDLHDHRLTQAGEIILQDKASCFPAHILRPPDGAVVIDACAAPGNKTSHLASLMHNTGRIIAVDKSEGRMKTMQTLLEKAGVTCVQTSRVDFLRVDPLDPAYADVNYILVDPSCSGSGMVTRLMESTDEEQSVSKNRLKSLSNFQVSMVKHALKFPGVQRVVYSTCSVYEEENEVVIDEVISQVKSQFVLQEVKPDWPQRGVKGHYCWDKCIRMSPTQDLTNGFFVACFERIKSEENKKCDINEDENTNAVKEAKEKRMKKKKRKKTDVSDDISNCNAKDLEVFTNDEKETPMKKKVKKGTCPNSEETTEVIDDEKEKPVKKKVREEACHNSEETIEVADTCSLIANTEKHAKKHKKHKHKAKDAKMDRDAENEAICKSEEGENETVRAIAAEKPKKKHKHKKKKKEKIL